MTAVSSLFRLRQWRFLTSELNLRWLRKRFIKEKSGQNAAFPAGLEHENL